MSVFSAKTRNQHTYLSKVQMLMSQRFPMTHSPIGKLNYTK